MPDHHNFTKDAAPITCNDSNRCATCMIMRIMLIHEQGLQEHLDNLQSRYNQERVAWADAQDQCRELQLSHGTLEHRCEVLEVALDEARNHQLETNKELIAERNSHAATQAKYSTLSLENQTLWRLFEEIAPSLGEADIPATIQELYHNNGEQQLLIQKLKDENRRLRGAKHSVESPENGCGYCQCATVIDGDNDYDQPQVLRTRETKVALKLLPSLLN
ncbi:hypothetical protein ACJ73_05105 [Blastomyces percursus]|uniref:Uncharacterized protein n=1 Tax=Blastomyces percursus TaxID=1658174 RepID=A0A1J9R6A4_9EURO|nr:hypothetical protein ACJ73_05105 [Blastomyces percursus]